MPVQDPQIRKNTLLALNMAVAAVKAIEESEDRIVLQQQYDAILKNLNVGRIDNDPKLRGLYTKLLETISEARLEESQRQRFVSVYDSQQRKSIIEGLGKALQAAGKAEKDDAALVAVSPWLVLGKALMRGVSAYLGYREARKQRKIELEEKLWRLDQGKIRAINALQIALFNTTWNVLSKTADPNERRLTDDDLRSLERATQCGTPEQTRFLLSWEEEKYRDYPPYWFYRGEAALKCGDEEDALSSFDQFDRASGDVLIRDPYKVQVAKYRIRLNPGASPKIVKEQLAIIRAHAVEWPDLLFYGVVSYAIGEKTQGISALKYIIYRGMENEISPLVLSAMECGQFDLEQLFCLGIIGQEQASVQASQDSGQKLAHQELKKQENARRDQQKHENQLCSVRVPQESATRERKLAGLICDNQLEAAIKIVIGTGIASSSALQRQMHIGFTRAARLIDMMESMDIVGPQSGDKPRRILVDEAEALEILDQKREEMVHL